MKRTAIICVVACFVGCVTAWADDEGPTPTTLEKWLEDKEVVELCFAGPHMEPVQLRDSLKTEIPHNDPNFCLSAGEGGGPNRSFVTVCMKADTENVRRLLALQDELGPRGYRLDPALTRVWSYKGDPVTREKARALVPEFFAAMERSIKEAVPGAQCRRQDGEITEITYTVVNTDVGGGLRVNEITPLRNWRLAEPPDEELHLPHLGLIITFYYRRFAGSEDPLVQYQVMRKAFVQEVEPFLKLEPGAAVKSRR